MPLRRSTANQGADSWEGFPICAADFLRAVEKLDGCAACSRSGESSAMMCYTVRRENERRLVSLCREYHSAFEKERRNPSGDRKVGRAVKGVVGVPVPSA